MKIPLQPFWLCVVLVSFASCSGGSNSPVPPGGDARTSSAQSTSALEESLATTAPTAPLRLLQVFDFEMTSSQVSTVAKQISFLWGGGSGAHGPTAAEWQTANPSLVDIIYFYQGTDDPGLSGHNLTWFQKYHPTWIVYDCDTNNRPTKTVAYQSGIGAAVPLDISNPAVISYQIHVAANAAIARKNN